MPICLGKEKVKTWAWKGERDPRTEGIKSSISAFFSHTANLITVEKVKIMIKQSHKGNTSLLPRGALKALDGLVEALNLFSGSFFSPSALGALSGDVLNTSLKKKKKKPYGCGAPSQMFMIYRGNLILPRWRLSLTLSNTCMECEWGAFSSRAHPKKNIPASFGRKRSGSACAV